MSTPEERAANAAKWLRFSKRHPRYREAYRRRDPYKMPHTGSKFRTFELADPRDPDQTPRLIGWCRTIVKPVWASLWSAKEISLSKWAAWMRNSTHSGSPRSSGMDGR